MERAFFGGHVPGDGQCCQIRREIGWSATLVLLRPAHFSLRRGGTCYGAAVITSSGFIYRAGQYSSFNHVTNVHAEQAALLLATEAGDPDILALAVASTGGQDVTRPCGVCRQVMAEHAARIGRDFEVLMARRHGTGYEVATVSDLLPMGWAPGSGPSGRVNNDIRRLPLAQGEAFRGGPLAIGDHVVLRDGCVAIVWDGEFEEDRALVKLKYAPESEGLRKLPHSFSQPFAYLRELYDLGWLRPTACGGQIAAVAASEVVRLLPSLALRELAASPPDVVLDVLASVGIDVEQIRVTGSRAIGLSTPCSDWDLIVPVAADLIPAVRARLAQAVNEGVLEIPETSGTWKLLNRCFPGGRDAIVRGRRFVETVSASGVGVALVFVPPEKQQVAVSADWHAVGRAEIYGTVRNATRAAYKRAEYEVEDTEGHVRVVCYHKGANLLAPGDVVSAAGWLLRRGYRTHACSVSLTAGSDSLVGAGCR